MKETYKKQIWDSAIFRKIYKFEQWHITIPGPLPTSLHSHLQMDMAEAGHHPLVLIKRLSNRPVEGQKGSDN